MKVYSHKFRLFNISICLLLLFVCQKQVVCQEEKPFNFDEIRKSLEVQSQSSESAEQLNEKLINDIRRRGVSFHLSKKDEKSLKTAGASDLLIENIRENISKKLEDQTTLYKKFVFSYDGNIDEKKSALEAAEEFVRKYSDDQDVKEIIDYLVIVIPELQKMVNCCEPDTTKYAKFNSAFKAQKWNEVFKAGEEILKTEPEFVDLMLTLASVGFDNTIKNSNREYLTQTLSYAEKSIELLNKEKGTPQNYGAFEYKYKNKEFPDGKANALGFMNYIIGYIKYFYQNQKDEAIPYFQKSLQFKSKANKLTRQLKVIPKQKIK